MVADVEDQPATGTGADRRDDLGVDVSAMNAIHVTARWAGQLELYFALSKAEGSAGSHCCPEE
jgi:hypothetical protein